MTSHDVISSFPFLSRSQTCQHVLSRLIFLFIAVDLLGENDVLEAQEQFWVFCLVVWSFQRATFPKFRWGLLKSTFCRGCKGQQPTMLARQLEFSFHVSLFEDYLDFCLVIVICEIFHCFEHNLDCLYEERSKRLCWQGNFLRHSREKYGGKYESRFIYIRSNEI